MRCSTHLVAAALALVVALPMGADAEDAFAPVAQGRHLRCYAPRGSGLTVDVKRSDLFVTRLRALFRSSADPARIEYYRHRSVAELSALLGFAASGVTDLRSGRVDSALAFHPHELVHATAAPLGAAPVFFSEGLAVALTVQGHWRGAPIDAAASRALGASGLRFVLAGFGQEPDRDYAIAGSFVAFLLERYGIDPFMAFMRGASRGWLSAFRCAYDRQFADLERAWHEELMRGGSPRRGWYDARTWPDSLRSSAQAARLASALDRRSAPNAVEPSAPAAPAQTLAAEQP
jgi:hypothetical protein